MMKQKIDYFKKVAIIMQTLAPEYGVAKAGIFGSLVNGTFGKNSDIDILVIFRVPMGFFKFVQLENRLKVALKRDVDLVTESALSPYFRNDVLKQLRVIYEEK